MQVWDTVNNNIKHPNILGYFEKTDEFSLIQTIYNDFFDDDGIQENLRINRKRRNQTKKRWVQSALKDFNNNKTKKKKELSKDYYQLSEYLIHNGQEKFKQEYGKLSPEELIEEKIVLIKSWSEDTNSYLSNYLYLTDKSDSQITKALMADIVVIIGDTLLKNYNGRIEDVIIEKPYSYVENSIFTDTRGKMDLSEDFIEKDHLKYHYTDYEPSDEYSLRVLVNKELVDEGPVGELDGTDQRIFSEVLAHRNEVFATQRKIYVEIGKLVTNLFNSDGLENYKLVADRLMKMVNISFNVKKKNKYLAFGIFDYVEIDMEDGLWTAEITINEVIYQEYLKKQTIRMYKAVIQNFELPTSKNLIFALQMERFHLRPENRSAFHQYPYVYFLTKLRFKSKNKRENYKTIKASLEEMVRNQVCVEEFYQQGEHFYIKYIPITDYEVEDLLHSTPRVKELLQVSSSQIPLETT